MGDMVWREAPLAELESAEELKGRYRAISSEVLRRWMDAVIGPHRDAMAAVLAEREAADNGFTSVR